MNFFRLIIVCLPLFIAACATPVTHNTASGKPEVTINTTNVKKVRTSVTEMSINWGYRPVRSDDTSLTFDKIINDGGIANFMLGSQYDMNPAARLHYMFLPIGKTVRVVADMSVITNPGSAFERRTDFNRSQDSNLIQQQLYGLKARLEGK